MSDKIGDEKALPEKEVLHSLSGASGFGFVPSTYDPVAHTVEILVSSGKRVRRWYGFLELNTSPDAIDISRVAAGQVNLFDSHNTDSIRNIAGSVIDVRFGNQGPVAKVRFAATELGQLAEGMISRGELKGASPGVTFLKLHEKIGEEDGDPIFRSNKWMLNELSLTGIPADGAAGTLSVERPGTMAAQAPQQEGTKMAEKIETAAATTTAATTPDPEALRAHGTETLTKERLRVKTIRELTKTAGLPVEVGDKLIDDGVESAHVGNKLIDELAARGAQPGRVAGQVGTDHTNPEELRERMSDALSLRGMHRAGVSTPEMLDKYIEKPRRDAAREFMQIGPLEMFADLARARGAKIPMRQTRDQLFERCREQFSLSTSDFPLLLASAANKILLPAYNLATPTFKRFFGLKTFNDFKAHNFLRAGDFPDLLTKGETGEFKYGALSESRQQVTAVEYGRILRISRQILINDDLGAFADIPAMAGRRVAVFENTLAFKQFTLNSNNGPQITEPNASGVQTATNMFDASTHANYTSSGTAISVASLGVGWAAMQKQKSMDGLVLNLAPAFLLVPPDQATLARQYASSTYAPNQPSAINPFAGLVEPLSDANLTSTTAWYLFATPAMCECLVYGYLSGQEGPRFAVQQGFTSEGVDLRIGLDMGVGGVDWRGAYKNAGA